MALDGTLAQNRDLSGSLIRTNNLSGSLSRAVGGGTSDYTLLTNKPSINNVELVGNKTSAQLGLDRVYIGDTAPTDPNVDVWIDTSGDADQPPVPEAATVAPPMDGTAAVGSSTKYARQDHVHPSDTSRLAANQGSANAGKFLVVGSDGIVAPVTQTPEVTNSTAGAVSVALDPETIYHFTGALTSLTLTLTSPASGQLAHYHFDFDSGSTAPTLTLPNTVTMPSGFTVEASKHYEIDILNNYGAVMAWANS